MNQFRVPSRGPRTALHCPPFSLGLGECVAGWTCGWGSALGKIAGASRGSYRCCAPNPLRESCRPQDIHSMSPEGTPHIMLQHVLDHNVTPGLPSTLQGQYGAACPQSMPPEGNPPYMLITRFRTNKNTKHVAPGPPSSDNRLGKDTEEQPPAACCPQPSGNHHLVQKPPVISCNNNNSSLNQFRVPSRPPRTALHCPPFSLGLGECVAGGVPSALDVWMGECPWQNSRVESRQLSLLCPQPTPRKP